MHPYHIIRFILASLLAAAVLQAAAARAEESSSFPGVQKLMNEEEFSASGLDKLSPEEIRALNQWLIRYTAGEAQVLITTDEEVIEADRNEEILSSIEQPFRGWSGNTRFKLANGQVWQQRRRGTYFHEGSDTRVKITKNFMGFHKMTMLESGKSVQVNRVQ